ncbi:SLAP domain-containing protein [Bombilactobacillus bombi]|uniref:SLAP domain-containing protein n=1 Tax=Bombilactobacillus bombi TaxID=1303590 RepID=UPI0015E5DF66|nr:SLAP domain-containing protein [Bombilactobacillus bombi]MBA1433683.1 hypothetical protein [Bombilactobacillus bombi]
MNKKILGLCAATLLLIGGGTVGLAQHTITPQAYWTADGVWHDMNEANWQNIHPRLTVSTGATNEEVMQQYLAKYGSLPTVISASGITGTVSYVFGAQDGNGKNTVIQWYATYPNGNRAPGPKTTLERQPQRPTVNTPSDMLLTTQVGQPLTEQQVLAGISAHSNNGTDSEENLRVFVQDLNTVNWNAAGYYTVHIEAKDRYNAPTVVIRTIRVEGNNQVTPPNSNQPVTPVTPPNNSQPNTPTPSQPNTPNTPNHEENHPVAPSHNETSANTGNGSSSVENSGISINDIITVTNAHGAPVYHIQGDSVTTTGRVLAPNSPWATNRKKVVNGNTYYQVSSTEWITSSDGQLKSNETQRPVNPALPDNSPTTTISGVVTVALGSGTSVYNINGDSVSKSGRILANNTAWKIDQKKNINGINYYKVSTNEWVKSSDVNLSGIEIGNRVATINKSNGAYVYSLNGDSMALTGRVLANHTPWLTKQEILINGTSYYQVSTNEWIITNDATLN